MTVVDFFEHSTHMFVYSVVPGAGFPREVFWDSSAACLTAATAAAAPVVFGPDGR